MKFNFVKNNHKFLYLTAAFVVVALISIGIWGLKLGIDFRGGTLFEYKLDGSNEIGLVVHQTETVAVSSSASTSSESTTSTSTSTDSSASSTDAGSSSVSTSDSSSATSAASSTAQTETKVIDLKPYKEVRVDGNYKVYFDALDDTQIKAVKDQMAKDYPNSKQVSVETISSQVGVEQSSNALLAVFYASIGIIIFLAISFKSVPRPFASWEFGLSAVIALLHDSIIVVGVFAFLGHFYGAEIDTLFITAILTVIGFSVHDTIVVFDRLRENLVKSTAKLNPKIVGETVDYKEIVNDSLLETFGRSINLTMTAILVLVAMLLWGPASLRWFISALLVGMVSGTYSSIFVATQLLVLIQDLKKKYHWTN